MHDKPDEGQIAERVNQSDRTVIPQLIHESEFVEAAERSRMRRKNDGDLARDVNDGAHNAGQHVANIDIAWAVQSQDRKLLVAQAGRARNRIGPL